METQANALPEAINGFQKSRWVCMIASLVICICAGFGYAWSVLQNPISSVFGWAESGVSMAYTIMVFCSSMAPLLFAPVIRWLKTRRCIMLGAVLFGGGLICTGLMGQLWQLYFFYGIIAGLGVGFIYPSMMAYVVRLFPEKSGMASGLGTAAYGSGAIIWAPVTVSLTASLSLSNAFRLLGAAFLVVVFLAALLLREPPEGFQEQMSPRPADAPAGGAGDLNRGQMVRTSAFYRMVIVFTFGLVAGVIVISQASPILQNAHGFTAARAAIFVSVFAACNMAGRFLWGSLSDKVGIYAAVKAVFALCILSMLILAFINNTIVAICAMGLAASCYGGLASVLTPLTSKTFGPRYITENYGVMYIVFGLASFIGPVLAVQFRNISGGSYSGAFLTAAVLAVAGLVIFLTLKPKKQQGDT